MPNNLQSRTDDMHKGEKRRAIRLSTYIIIGGLFAIIALIVGLT